MLVSKPRTVMAQAPPGGLLPERVLPSQPAPAPRRKERRMPLTKVPASSPSYFFARVTASLTATPTGTSSTHWHSEEGQLQNGPGQPGNPAQIPADGIALDGLVQFLGTVGGAHHHLIQVGQLLPAGPLGIDLIFLGKGGIICLVQPGLQGGLRLFPGETPAI